MLHVPPQVARPRAVAACVGAACAGLWARHIGGQNASGPLLFPGSLAACLHLLATRARRGCPAHLGSCLASCLGCACFECAGTGLLPAAQICSPCTVLCCGCGLPRFARVSRRQDVRGLLRAPPAPLHGTDCRAHAPRLTRGPASLPASTPFHPVHIAESVLVAGFGTRTPRRRNRRASRALL